MYIHEDERRKLAEITGDFKALKLLSAKEDCVVGDHYHKNKDEKFILLRGAGKYQINQEIGELRLGEVYVCERGTYHKFALEKGALLLGTASELYDPNDEHR